MTERVPCATPACRRSIRAGRFSEWVCQKCYGRVPRELKKAHVDAKRNLRILRKRPTADDQIEAAWVRADLAWAAVKNAARGGMPDDDTLREMGIF